LIANMMVGGRMKRLFPLIAGWVAITASGSAQGVAPRQQPATAAPAAVAAYDVPARAVFDKYCVTCHNQKLKTGGLMLDTLDPANVAEGAATWEKVVRRLRGGSMPPAGMPRPDPAIYDSVAGFLETELDRAAAAAPNPGKVPAFQRLTRTEYQNAIRDLLALDDLPKAMEIALLLPADNSSSGFDNLRELLFVSETQLDQYLSAARKISRLAVGDRSIPPILDTYRVSPDLPQDGHIEGTPFGARGGAVIHTTLPLDGEYGIEVELAGATLGDQFEASVDGERVHLFTVVEPPAPKEDPITDDKTSLKDIGSHKFMRDRIASRRAAMNKGFEARIPMKAGQREIVVTFLKHTSARGEEVVRRALRGRGGQPGVSTITLRGPYTITGPGETASRKRIFACRPSGTADETRCARQIISTLARRAYRRPLTEADVQELLPFYASGKAEGGFETGIQWALERILVSPEFLFRVEMDKKGGPNSTYRVSDVELASRLSMFLWSSIPDDELLAVAEQGKLKDRAVLERQVRRMLADPRSRSLVTNFAAQWLYLRDLQAKNPNSRFFRDFDKGLQQDFERETDLFVDSILREDRSVLDLLNANYTFVNERLAKHYGIPGVYGSEFRRVTLSDDSPRRGLLGKGSILTLTSYATRTSPVLRGKYILNTLLGTPPPPPPPNIPALAEKANDGKALSMREAMARHRANPVCASCHARMDPLGFAMENFDAVGQWRTRAESGEALDVSGVYQDGAKFDGIAGLREQLMRRPDQFLIGMTENLLTYAVGRKAAYYDAPAIRAIVREAARSEYRFSTLVLGVINSVPFQMRVASQAQLSAGARP
jgi:mono/diheme cytochrome c family protein